jgi:hypothetical protein
MSPPTFKPTACRATPGDKPAGAVAPDTPGLVNPPGTTLLTRDDPAPGVEETDTATVSNRPAVKAPGQTLLTRDDAAPDDATTG